ncbi:sensor histidine kinase [Sphingomonas sp. Leaf343]|uniref:sensor histidine kinase n=1 Tax=Sphingomonas sp. Leaf343 TaxID=1736345 RepID=UPI0006F602BE|nr:PAS domain-containing protein [Sphingomonas sp. Leaf343]KQR83641.1 histidine kinase [Sphingomonas sp. Leaf343]
MTIDRSILCDDRRTRVLASYDTGGLREAGALDDIVAFAARLCDAPVALVTLVEAEYQQFLARTGIDQDRTPSDISFCAHALGGPDLLEVTDATQDARFADNPLVTGDLNVRFYAGVPMVSSDGIVLGTVCVIDTVPRPLGLTPLQREGLILLAKAAMARLDDRRTSREQGEAEALSRQALQDSEQRFRTLADTMPQMVWSTLPDGFHDYYNARWYEFTGVPQGSTDGEAWNDMFHPDDQDRAWSVWRHSLDTGNPYDIEYRLKHFDGTYRWVLGRALPIRDAEGGITRWFGTCTDIHEQKLALDEREVISQELSHRIKNIFAVIAGLVGFAARARPEFAPAATDLRQRITALGRAHDFVRPHSAQSRPASRQDSLHGLLQDLFSPYSGADEERIVVDGAMVTIDDRSATPLALLFHELATNATKYGALSIEGGHVVVTVDARDEHVVMTWCEQGGPAVIDPGVHHGFGSQLIELSAVRQLGGTVKKDWRAEGLVVVIEIPTAALSRDKPGS